MRTSKRFLMDTESSIFISVWESIFIEDVFQSSEGSYATRSWAPDSIIEPAKASSYHSDDYADPSIKYCLFDHIHPRHR